MRYDTIPPLSPTEEREYLSRYQDTGDPHALDQLVRSNMRFVHKVAREMCATGDYSNCLQAGAVGLITAAQRYDLSNEWRFISYAVHWIRKEIYDLYYDQRISTPTEVQNDYARAIEQNDAPTPPPPPAHYSEAKCRLWEIHANRNKTVTAATVDLPDPSPSALETMVLEDDRRDAVRVLDVLDERTRDIMKRYYGIGTEPETQADIARDAGLTRERVRQIIDYGRRRCRNSIRRSARNV
jgi:RNA polymerase primary sigma factor